MDAVEVKELRKAFMADIQVAQDQLRDGASEDELRLACHTLAALALYAGRQDLQEQFNAAGREVRAGRQPDLAAARAASRELEDQFRDRLHR